MGAVASGGADPVTRWTVDALESGLDGFRLGPVDLELTTGSVVALLGPSGAGKTSLLRALAGFLPAWRGRILRDGADVTSLAPERRRLGYVPQGLGLFPHLSVLRNVSYPLDIVGRLDAKSRARILLERFGIAHLATRRPSQLSGGEQQRVALARALNAEPELVLWDEPAQALDVEARHALGGVLEELRSEARAPVLLVTHDPSLAFSVADAFVVLRDGRVQQTGDASALLRRPRDAFTARFTGYENVFDRATLEAPDAGELASWLLARAGAEGVAFPRPTLAPGAGASSRWAGTVRSVRPTPDGLAVAVRAGSIDVAARAPLPDGAGVPAVGSPVRWDVDETRICPLGGARGAT
jgi:ABC-type Fe3+/spermidine/putrescine transport system ATPase subunit